MLSYIVHHFSPYLIQWGPNGGIRYYGLSYLMGFIFLYWGLRYQVKKGWLRLRNTQIDDFVFWIAFGGVVIGGRLGYCLIYDGPGVWHDPLRIFRVWEGGMSSHGGILGVIIVMLIFAQRFGVSFYHLADAAACVLLVDWASGESPTF